MTIERQLGCSEPLNCVGLNHRLHEQRFLRAVGCIDFAQMPADATRIGVIAFDTPMLLQALQ